MKLATVTMNNRTLIAALVDDGKLIDLEAAGQEKGTTAPVPKTMIEAIKQGDRFLAEAKEIVNWTLEQKKAEFVYAIDDKNVKVQAPIPRPAKNIMCAGKNYAEHAKEMGSEADIPTDPIIFTKSPTTVIANHDEINPHRDVTESLDYEGEIAVIIGKQGKNIKAEHANDHIYGYTLLNDVTARDVQKRHKQFFLGKSFDTFSPMGPAIVPKEELDGQHLSLRTYVNNDLRQETTTENMIFSIPQLIEIISRGMTLEPGDIIATGTPAGVGAGFNPPKFLQPGDKVVIEVDGIGQLQNTVAPD
ncbi:fumarylacetoacetate hydrolase family protein [Alteribacillus iranensis]|uniref:2-keto-4-pentenoate hydratase/2-oxohepta-3-ene-1,7-dioic acid hydratase (Catechol pathway) n=1 Tax=Alteribacillus iranensis TaxID=930128 RepID=A0A1I2CW42_9BACI|nr:fumarylacetoacetate hydrolase family protein [Alteribacillus iranensis]SFE72432.1 2-keto-4-pentenoate hydratase/2-oxohepta-3-ene-1,7-dioic acid hydratase (catechol pathway) [Alteribacillus iranensis]